MPPDSGASAERTRLSWRRTTLTGTVVALLLARLALRHDNATVALITTALAGLCWVGLVVLVQRRIQSLREPQRPPRRFLMLTSALCACFGALGVVLVLR